MTKTGGIFPLLAAIPALISAAAPSVGKAAAIGAVGTTAGMALKKVTGKGIVHKGDRKKDKQEVSNVLDAISRNPKIPLHKIVHKYTASQFENSNNK